MEQNTVTSFDACAYVSKDGLNVGWGEAFASHRKKKEIYQNKISIMDDNGTIRMNVNNIHIQPINNGFIVTIRGDDDAVNSYSFNEFIDMLDFLKDNPIMDLDSGRVADNV